MKLQFTGAILLVAVLGYAHAQSEVYLCVDGQGNKEYKNTGATKGCKKVDLPSITTIPAPVMKRSPGASSDFPKVTSDTQRARDNDRRQILQDELKNEEDKLANLRKEYNNGEPERRGDERNYAKYQERTAAMKDEINRSEQNVEALKRELNSLK
jgi:HAMP domain-containing protein